MTRITALFFAVALTAFSCSTVSPYIKPISDCAGKSVSTSDADEAINDLLTQNWADLAMEGARIGWDVLDCVITNITTQAPGLKGSATEFKSLHSVEFRAAGVSACNVSAPERSHAAADAPLAWLGSTPAGAQHISSAPQTLQVPAAPGATARGDSFAYAGENVGSRATGCDVACGNRKSLAPPSGCMCQVGDGRGAHWIAAR